MLVLSACIARTPRFVALIASAGLASCASVLEPDQTLSVATERERYTRPAPDQLASVTFEARNDGRGTVYLGRCGSAVSAYVDRLEAGGWAEYARLAVVCQAAYEMSPLALPPAEGVTAQAVWLGAGLYRLRVPFGLSATGPFDRTAISNSFVVE
jgi:hypothetical protein